MTDNENKTGSYFSIADVAAFFSVSPATVKRWIRDGEMRAVQLSARIWRIPSEEIKRFSKKEEDNA